MTMFTKILLMYDDSEITYGNMMTKMIKTS